MEYRIERSNIDSGHIRVARLQTPRVRTSHFKPLVQEPVPAIRVASEPLSPPHVAPLARAAKDSSPEAQARRATRRLRQQFKKAGRAAKRQACLCRADEYELLRIAYAAVRCWQQDGVEKEVERELRAEAEIRNEPSIKPVLGAPSLRLAPPRR
jgi:hypothetical protein